MFSQTTPSAISKREVYFHPDGAAAAGGEVRDGEYLVALVSVDGICVTSQRVRPVDAAMLRRRGTEEQRVF